MEANAAIGIPLYHCLLFTTLTSDEAGIVARILCVTSGNSINIRKIIDVKTISIAPSVSFITPPFHSKYFLSSTMLRA